MDSAARGGKKEETEISREEEEEKEEEEDEAPRSSPHESTIPDVTSVHDLGERCRARSQIYLSSSPSCEQPLSRSPRHALDADWRSPSS